MAVGEFGKLARVDTDPRGEDTIVSVRDFTLSDCCLKLDNARDCPSIIILIAESSSSAALEDTSKNMLAKALRKNKICNTKQNY